MDELLKKAAKWWNEASIKKRWSVIALVVGVICTIALFFISGSAESASPAASGSYLEEFGNPLYYLGVIVKTLGILLLIVGGAIVVKRIQKKPIGIRPDKTLELVETTRLSPKQAVHLVRAGRRFFLVGATDQNLNLISEVDLVPLKADEDHNVSENRFSFKEILAGEASTTSDSLEPRVENCEQFVDIFGK